MAVKFSDFSTGAADSTNTRIVGYVDGTTTNNQYTLAQLAPFTGLYAADGTLSGARSITFGANDLTFNASGGGRIIYSGAGEQTGYALISTSTGEASWNILSVAGGGTGATTFTANGILIGNTASAISATAELTDGQLLIGYTGNAPVAATLTQGTDLSITNGNGSINIGHATVSNTPASSSTTLSAGDNFTAINSVTVSAQGHLTAQTTKTYTLPSGYSLPLATSSARGGIQIGATGLGAKEYAVQLSSEKAYVAVPWVNTSYSTFTYDASDPANNSTSGLVPAPTTSGDNAKFLTGAATWATPTDTGVTGVTLALGTGATSPLAESITSRELTITSNKYGGTNQVGYVPEGGTASTFLRGDGTWVTPTNTQNTTGAADPSATISGTVVNGSATTFMRSDAVPALGSTITIGTGGSARGLVDIEGGSSLDAQLRLNCSAGTHAVVIEGPQHSGGNNYIIKLPHGAPALNKILKVGTYAANAGTYADPSLATMVWGDASITESFIIAASDETTALSTGTAKATFRMPYAFTLTGVRASVGTAPVGSVITVDINEAGSSILSTKITIDAGEKTSTTAATAPVISDSALADDAEITIDIDTVGSSTAGAGLKVTLIGNQ